MHIYAIYVGSVKKKTEISQSIIARLLACMLGIKNSGMVQTNADHINIHPALNS